MRIGKNVDSVFFLAYGSKRSTPGPLSDFKWLENHLKRALRAIPPEKLVHGIATYGLRWGEKGITSGTWKQFFPKSPETIMVRDLATKAVWYKQGSETTWLEDAESIVEKIKLGRALGIPKVSFWRIGGEDPRLWPMLKNL